MDTPPIEANFASLILSINHSARIGLGLIENPELQTVEKNLSLAQYNIDLLSLLKDKTKNNLAKEEKQLLNQIITDLQMNYIKAK